MSRPIKVARHLGRYLFGAMARNERQRAHHRAHQLLRFIVRFRTHRLVPGHRGSLGLLIGRERAKRLARHPISGRTVGAVDLTCWRKDADPLLIALAKTTADQIMHALLADSNTQEVQLLQEFLRTCKRTSGMVLALSRDTVMLNDYARQLLDPADQAVLLGQAAVALDSGQQGPVQIALPTGVNARLYCRPI